MKKYSFKFKLIPIFLLLLTLMINSNKTFAGGAETGYTGLAAWGVAGGFSISNSVSYRPVGYGLTAKCSAEDDYSKHPTVDEQYSISCIPIYDPSEVMVYPTNYTFTGIPSSSGVIKKSKVFLVFNKRCGRHGCWWTPVPPLIVYLQMNAYNGETTMGDLDSGDWDSLFHQDDNSSDSDDSDNTSNGGVDYNSSFNYNDGSSNSYDSSSKGSIADSIFNPGSYDSSFSDVNSGNEKALDSATTDNQYNGVVNDAFNDSDNSYNSNYQDWASSSNSQNENTTLDNYFNGTGDYTSPSTDNISSDITGLENTENNISYDENGNPISSNSNNGSMYDENGNLIDSNSNNNSMYDANGNLIDNSNSNNNSMYDANGNLIDSNSNNNSMYDANGNLIDSNSNNNSMYDANGNLIDSNSNNMQRNSNLYSDMLGMKYNENNNEYGLSFEAFKKMMGFGTDGLSGDVNKDIYGAGDTADGSLSSVIREGLGLSDNSINDIIKNTLSSQDMSDIAKKLLMKSGYTLDELKKGKNYDKNSAYTEPKYAWDMNRITKLLKNKEINLTNDENTQLNTEEKPSSLISGANSTILYNNK